MIDATALVFFMVVTAFLSSAITYFVCLNAGQSQIALTRAGAELESAKLRERIEKLKGDIAVAIDEE